MAASMKALAAIRQVIADTEGEIAAIDNAGLTADDVTDRVKALVSRLRTRFDEGYIGLALTNPNGTVTTTDFMNACTEAEAHPGDEALVIEAWLRPEALEQKLLAAAAPFIQSGKTALPLDQRPAMARKLDARLHELMVEEEAMIMELLDSGHEVFRRGAIDPLVILGVST
jgi:hypothetical protein